MTPRRVISVYNLPSKFPTAWMVVAYLVAERMNTQAAMVAFCILLAITSIVYAVRVFTEIGVEVVDPAVLNEEARTQQTSN